MRKINLVHVFLNKKKRLTTKQNFQKKFGFIGAKIVPKIVRNQYEK